MKPVIINGDVWRVTRVKSRDPHLVDRTNTLRLATTDPITRTIYVSENVAVPLLDKVVMHEIAHAVTISYSLLKRLRDVLPAAYWIFVEEWAAQLVENHAIETARLASEALGRPVCVRGFCDD